MVDKYPANNFESTVTLDKRQNIKARSVETMNRPTIDWKESRAGARHLNPRRWIGAPAVLLPSIGVVGEPSKGR